MPNQEITKNKLPRLDFIDALRGIAVLGVVMIHTWGVFRLLGPHTASFVDWGSSGVKLFFIISAFTIFLSLNNRKEKSFKGYFTRRFFRIAPLFYIILLINFILLNSKDYHNLIAKLFFIDNFYLNWVNNQIIGVEWTIGVEMIFYIIASFLFLKIKNLKDALVFVFVTFLIPLFINIYHIYPDSPEWQLYRAFSILSHLYIFAFGICIFFLYKKYELIQEKRRIMISNICLIILMTVILFDYFGIEDKYRIIHIFYSMNLQFLLYFGLLFFASIKSFLRNLWVNIFTVYIGKISYSVYLTHLMINTIILSIFTNMNPWYLVFISFITILTISSLTYYFIEKPFIKKGNNLINKFSNI